MAYATGDGKYQILWKLVELEGGIPRCGDSVHDLLAKYLRAIGGTPMPGDHFNTLLARVVTLKGGTPLPGDKEWDLLVKWLQAEGECRACGDAPHDLWKKVLELGETDPEPPVTAPEVRVQQGATVITDGQVTPIEFGYVCQSGDPSSLTFTVYNDGTANLTTSGLVVPSGYSITNALAATIAPGASDSFTVQLDNNATEGNKAGTISFANNDSNENPFNFPINGDVANPVIVDSATTDESIPWNGILTWTWGGDACVGMPDPDSFGIEVSEDGGSFGGLELVSGALREYTRASDGLPHTWIFRIAAYSGLIQVTEQVESAPFIWPP